MVGGAGLAFLEIAPTGTVTMAMSFGVWRMQGVEPRYQFVGNHVVHVPAELASDDHSLES
jgi:hypothetical protein